MIFSSVGFHTLVLLLVPLKGTITNTKGFRTHTGSLKIDNPRTVSKEEVKALQQVKTRISNIGDKNTKSAINRRQIQKLVIKRG